jgi:hypothetical protein
VRRFIPVDVSSIFELQTPRWVLLGRKMFGGDSVVARGWHRRHARLLLIITWRGDLLADGGRGRRDHGGALATIVDSRRSSCECCGRQIADPVSYSRLHRWAGLRHAGQATGSRAPKAKEAQRGNAHGCRTTGWNRPARQYPQSRHRSAGHKGFLRHDARYAF